MVNDEYPKLDPSKPRATSVNCCAASRVFFRERDLIRVRDICLDRSSKKSKRKKDSHPATALINLAFASGPALLGTKSSCTQKHVRETKIQESSDDAPTSISHSSIALPLLRQCHWL